MSSSLNIEEVERESLDENDSVPLTKPVREKKPRTAKQMEALAKGREKIKENVKQRREQKKIEASKLLLANGIELPTAALKNKKPPALNLSAEEADDTGESSGEETPPPVPKQKKKPKRREQPEAEVEEEVVYIKKAKSKAVAPKKKQKKIIVYQDASSESESDDYDSDASASPPPAAHHFKSQRNKKSLVKVYETPVNRQTVQQSMNYFCD